MADLPNNATDICNLALDHLNQTAINSIDDPVSKTEQLCARWYEHMKKATLRMHSWNFAMKRTQLAASATAPVFEFDTKYPLPADYIRLIQIGSDTVYKYYGVEDNHLLLNSASAAMPFRYVYNVTNVSKMDALFLDAFAANLALRLVYPITGSNTATERIMKLLSGTLELAKNVDGQERPPRRYERSRFKEARRKFGTYGSKYLEDY